MFCILFKEEAKKIDRAYEAKRVIRQSIKDLERDGLVYFKDSSKDLYEVTRWFQTIIISDPNCSEKIGTVQSFPLVHHNAYVHSNLSCRTEHSITSDQHFDQEKMMEQVSKINIDLVMPVWQNKLHREKQLTPSLPLPEVDCLRVVHLGWV